MEGSFTELEQLNPKMVVTSIMRLMEKGLKDDAIIEHLKSEFNISNDDAHFVLELTRTGLFRATMLYSGKPYPIHDNNPLTNAALQLGLEQLEREKKTEKKKRWWEFWKYSN
jgi:hypothetical protein